LPCVAVKGGRIGEINENDLSETKPNKRVQKAFCRILVFFAFFAREYAITVGTNCKNKRLFCKNTVNIEIF
jgi:hypothetical protein